MLIKTSVKLWFLLFLCLFLFCQQAIKNLIMSNYVRNFNVLKFWFRCCDNSFTHRFHCDATKKCPIHVCLNSDSNFRRFYYFLVFFVLKERINKKTWFSLSMNFWHRSFCIGMKDVRWFLTYILKGLIKSDPICLHNHFHLASFAVWRRFRICLLVLFLLIKDW